MNRLRLVLAGLRHHARTNAGVALGSAVGAAVLVGALSVGDSVRASLREQALERIGAVDVVLAPGDRFFRSALADELAADGSRRTAAVLQLGGVASTSDASRRANGAQVLGVDARFFELALEPWGGARPGPGEVLLNARLARQLEAASGDRIVLRVAKPSALPRDMALAEQEDHLAALRVEVIGVLPDAAFGGFSLASNPIAPYGAFLSREWLQERLELGERANLMLVDHLGEGEALASARLALDEAWTLADGQLAIEGDDERGVLEVASARIFLDAAVGVAAQDLASGALGVLTYFVNELRVEDRATPYSMVAALGPLGSQPALGTAVGSDWRSVVPPDLGPDGIVINTWLAADLKTQVGDELALTYFVMGDGARLLEVSRTFRVRGVVAIEGLAGDPGLMPDFPGLADSDSCRDWDPGFPLDLERIRDEDEAWWDEHRGTPKAFVSLEAGRAMWANRFGDLTALRVPAAATDAGTLARDLRAELAPAALGLFPRDLRGPALAGGTSATDFGGLFLGLSFFLIVSALLLTSMLFAFGVEQRARELGTLLAVGFTPSSVRRLFLAEAAVLAALGSGLGALLGLGYTRLVLAGLVTVWSDAVAGATLGFQARPSTVLAGAGMSFVAALASIALALRAPLRAPAARLLAGALSAGTDVSARAPRASRAVAGLSIVGAVLLFTLVDARDAATAAGSFFAAGALLLVGGIAASRMLLAHLSRGAAARPAPRSATDLGLRSTMRRPGRSLATIALLASGTFLVLAVGANELAPPSDPTVRDSGTGGFTLFGSASVPIVHDLESEEGREFFGLDEEDLAGVGVVPLRVRAGDEASCLNLGVPQNPRLVGLRPEALVERGAFAFAARGGVPAEASPWRLLDELDEDGAIPAIGDQASVTWVLKKKVGDTLDYVDERGEPFRVRLVATVANSILQGNLVISSRRFEELFPSESGHGMFLLDVPPERVEAVSARLGRALSDVGLELVPTAARLAEFNAVQNTYLLIFQLLGYLGLLLGSLGLGMIVLRNALERRSELALLRAVGFTAGALRGMLFAEHALLLGLGLLVGCGAAAAALAPSFLGGAAAPALGPLAGMVAGLTLSGLVWLALATSVALRGPLLEALRAD